MADRNDRTGNDQGASGSDRPGDPRASSPPRTTQEALERAGEHARRSLGEAIASLHALTEAASLALTAETSEAHPALHRVARTLEDLASSLKGAGAGGSAPLLEAVLAAVDHEIARWEELSGDDREARAVLRAFLGLREILWEFGVRPEPESPRRRERPAARGPRAARARRRVQRVDVQG